MEKDNKVLLFAVLILLVSMFSFELFGYQDNSNLITGNQVSQEVIKSCQQTCTESTYEQRCQRVRVNWFRTQTRCANYPVQKINQACYNSCTKTQPPKPSTASKPSNTVVPPVGTALPGTAQPVPQNPQQVPAEYQKCTDSCTKNKVERVCKKVLFSRRCYNVNTKYIDPLCVADCNKRYLPDLNVPSANFIDNNGNSITSASITVLVKPLATIKNIGSMQATNFKVKIEILKDSVVKRTEVSPATYTLQPGENKLIDFSTNYKLTETGTYNITHGYDEHGKLIIATMPAKTIVLHYEHHFQTIPLHPSL